MPQVTRLVYPYSPFQYWESLDTSFQIFLEFIHLALWSKNIDNVKTYFDTSTVFPLLTLSKCSNQSLKKCFEINISGQVPKQKRSKVSTEHNANAGVFEDITWSHPLLQSWRPVWIILGFCAMHFYPHSPIPFGRPTFFFLRLENTDPVRITDWRLISCDV